MSYVVFARKWRPQKFDEIIGQDHIVTTLKNAILKKRLAYAYLFAGPKGIGKTSTARILAKSLNCVNGPTVEPCQKCASCTEITDSRSLDVLEIDGASNTGVDNIRDLRQNAKFSPVHGRFKVYIIDEVHMLSDSAFNALLKILEEPPEHVKFIFATTHPHKIPPTIISRCQRFDFNRISTLKIIEQLEKIAKSEKLDIDRQVLSAVARASEGSLRDAESVLDQLVSFARDKVTVEDVVTVLGSTGDEALFEIADSILNKDSMQALGVLDKIISEGRDLSNFLQDLIMHFRNLMIARVSSGDQKLLDLPEDICRRLVQQSGRFALDEIFSIFNLLVNTHEVSKRLNTLKIPIEIALVKLTHSKKKVKSQISPPKVEKEPSFKLNPAQEPPPIPVEIKTGIPEQKITEEEAHIDHESVASVWNELIQRIEKIKMSIATYLRESIPIASKGRKVTIALPEDQSFHKEVLERKENRLIIEEHLNDLLKDNVRLDFTLTERKPDEADKEADAFIKSTLDTFGGKIL